MEGTDWTEQSGGDKVPDGTAWREQSGRDSMEGTEWKGQH